MLSVILKLYFKTMTLSLLKISKALEAKIRDTRDLEPRLGRLLLLLLPQTGTVLYFNVHVSSQESGGYSHLATVHCEKFNDWELNEIDTLY